MFAWVPAAACTCVAVDATVLAAARVGSVLAVSRTAPQRQRHSNTDFAVTDVVNPA